MSENKEPDILFQFLKELIEDKKEQSVLELVFQNLSEDEIIEKLIDYKPSKE
ncbi:hypothetical protein MUY27_00030 [Mucilaginibacter sp. RS28]|uniref:Uncharacterized protein n=1 Tax=Mucilaginibacter straminoryzae TaxID=2932774 RepID=A0A9X1WZX5_9SPHI|nr:hypothetical protein [Mucilaginibacter straminoryzae]MCJ8208071.1 hypothetical protein [Mucilaginibacter straminoryzae]